MGQSADFICLPKIKHARGRFPSRIHGTIQNLDVCFLYKFTVGLPDEHFSKPFETNLLENPSQFKL